ncbi:hypothetical protein ACQ4PT_011281 [Festuca glaucescens]
MGAGGGGGVALQAEAEGAADGDLALRRKVRRRRDKVRALWRSGLLLWARMWARRLQGLATARVQALVVRHRQHGQKGNHFDLGDMLLLLLVFKRDFEFDMEKSAPHRFIAHCKRKDEDDCPWRIHASTNDDLCTVVVRTNPFDHDCSSTNRKKKVKNATKHWICEKVKDWLIEDATLGADELRKKLKEHYKIKIHYKRVYMGKLLALKQLYGD